MFKHWTFGQKVGLGFAAIVVPTIAISVVAIFALQSVVAGSERLVVHFGENIIDALRLDTLSAEAAVEVRGYILDKDETHVALLHDNGETFNKITEQLRGRLTGGEALALLDRVTKERTAYEGLAGRVIDLSRGNEKSESIVALFRTELAPKQRLLASAVEDLAKFEERARDAAKQRLSETASSATLLVTLIAVIVAIFATFLGFILTRSLGAQIGGAVGQVQSSSAELQAVANQQATGAREQVTAMSEIATTINELLATSRQIAESGQQVAKIAEQTATSARTGDGAVLNASESVTGIRQQVDTIVKHMLDLGKKSQQIGAVLDIVSELAEQTNILAINATIEAAGAGEAGERFAVVADEIRKLADRVAGSTKEIRSLIEDVRGAVNTTVMTTETGSKAVDAGMRQFQELAAAFRQISQLVTTTTEAAREIELSTKQQSTAVEQVNIAISNVSQATRETEASSNQTLLTASQLAQLSKDLLRLVQPQHG